jgi:hypothetical protein
MAFFTAWDYDILRLVRRGEYEDLSDRLKNMNAERLKAKI